MYKEEYEQKGFPFRDFLLKLILIIITVFLIIWLIPKFTTPKTNTKCKNDGKCNISEELKGLKSQIFADNIEKMKEAAIKYYTEERLPKEIGESDKMTLSDMIGKKLVLPLIDKDGKACDVEKSYVKITKIDTEYLLKVNLKTSTEEDYILVHLGCYNYCSSYICEKNTTKVNIKGSKPTSIVSIRRGGYTIIETDDSTDPDDIIDTPDLPTPTDDPIDDPTDPDPTIPDNPPVEEKGYVYEYMKKTSATFSNWSNWSAWTKTDCSQPEITCNDSSENCLMKLQRYDRKEKIGTYQKAYVKTRTRLVNTGSYNQNTCRQYNYVIINNTTYATTSTTNYATTSFITPNTRSTTGSWTYVGRYEYANPPSDTSTTHYEFAGANFSYCNDTCASIPNYYYDKYQLSAPTYQVSSTTSLPTTSTTKSTTTSSTNTNVTASCGSYTTKNVPIYSAITTSDKAYRTEPLYGTVCYQSTKTRTLKKSASKTTKWSSYNDKSLLNNGWFYTGNKKKK